MTVDQMLPSSPAGRSEPRVRASLLAARVISSFACLLVVWGAPAIASAADRYVATTGNDGGNDCTKQASPCRTIRHGIGQLAGGDTLIVGDGTYAESITNMPSGTAGAYTTIRAANDWGVLIDGSEFPNDFRFGINVSRKSYVAVRGFRVKMNQANENNSPIVVIDSDHVKVQRCGASHAPASGNAASIGIGPNASFVLVEESYAFGGGRYQVLVYQSDHVVVRRSVARNDHWTGSLQCAGFVNYDSLHTAWQNDIVLDSDTAHCAGRLYGGFWNENKDDHGPDTSQTLAGNIILNVQAFYAADLDWGISGTRNISDTVIWGCSGGYYGDQGPGVAARVDATRLTIGGISGRYNGPNGGAAHGTGWSIFGPIQNSLTSSILAKCESLGIADHTVSDFNVLSGNGANYGGRTEAKPGSNDKTDIDALNGGGLRWLPHIDVGSPLKTAGKDGGQAGAEVTYKIGVAGTLHGEPGWDRLTNEPLWPFPNEDRIKGEMASYSGPGAPGARGFATGKSLDGSDQTLTKYVWEFLGNPIPKEIYSGGAVEPPPPASGESPPGAEGSDPLPLSQGTVDEGGCGCRVGAAPPRAFVFAGGVIFVSMLARRRRRSGPRSG